MHIVTPDKEKEDLNKEDFKMQCQTFTIHNEKAKALCFQATDLLSHAVNVTLMTIQIQWRETHEDIIEKVVIQSRMKEVMRSCRDFLYLMRKETGQFYPYLFDCIWKSIMLIMDEIVTKTEKVA